MMRARPTAAQERWLKLAARYPEYRQAQAVVSGAGDWRTVGFLTRCGLFVLGLIAAAAVCGLFFVMFARHTLIPAGLALCVAAEILMRRNRWFASGMEEILFIVGLTLLALYGPKGPVGIDVAYTRGAVLLALLFVTLPFVVRSVQPVLLALDREQEEAAATLGAGTVTTFRRIILPALRPAILAGAGLAFARSLGEFGSLVLISGNLPFKTEVASVWVYGQIQSDNLPGAAAVSVVLLAFSFALLLGIGALSSRWSRHAG